ncbi:triadin isoform X2 [Anthonomus grandis grandis]|uniref:triadin isoform X2 n=1 Tax=Anthonomus grandis grandis TaxID=2921223 RepID=UPI0021662C61|nr:triadin isoform X2 [Anthonomus grandis grandis]
MSRKLSNFRQLSLGCDQQQKKRAGLTKQFSEDVPEPWFDQQQEIQVSLNKPKKPAPSESKSVKLAWGDGFNLNEEVIIKKCKEVKRERGKLTRHPSLEKDSILNSKQEFNKPRASDKENEKSDNKTNSLQIYLAHNLQDSAAAEEVTEPEKFEPKYLQPLIDFNQSKPFQIKKNSGKKIPEKPPFGRSNTIVVVPLENHKEERQDQEEEEAKADLPSGEGINVIIRPMTAQSRREKFQKRTSSAFHKEQANFRPPLVRSSSAPSTKHHDKGKFLASKRKVKTSKRSPKSEEPGEASCETKEWKNAAQPPPEIVTMVSLISPSGSENEAESEDERERPKSVLKSPSGDHKNAATPLEGEGKNVTLRKTVKSVSFQQSSIHAVRSFSASFPARRASMAAALSTHPNTKNGPQKGQEKRGTNPGSPDADERVPKRRLLRSNTEESKASSSWKKATSQIGLLKAPKGEFSVDIQTKGSQEGKESMKLDLEDNVILITPEEKKPSPEKPAEERPASDDTPKEKQCWAMYCKMTEKGINVSYDTILRGMLTPTEYRIRRKTSIAEEMNIMVNPAQASSEEEEDQKPGTH